MALAVAQSTTGTGSYLNSLSATAFASAVTSGSAIIVGIVAPINTATDVTSVTDTQSNSYSRIASVSLAADYVLVEVWAAFGVTGGSSFTVTAHDTGYNLVGIYAYEVTTSGTVSYDTSGNGTSDYSGTSVSSSLTTTTANELLLGFASKDAATGTWTNTSGWGNFLSLNTIVRSMAQTKAAPTAALYSQTFVSSNAIGLAAVVVAIKETSSGVSVNSNFFGFM